MPELREDSLMVMKAGSSPSEMLCLGVKRPPPGGPALAYCSFGIFASRATFCHFSISAVT